MKTTHVSLALVAVTGISCWIYLGGIGKYLDQEFKKEMDESGEQKEVQAEVIAAHKTSIRHKESILKSSKCGCFYCLAIFEPSEISDWTDKSEPEPKHTALCPKCGIDSVIGSDSGYPITSEFLLSMQRHWF